MGTLSPSPWDLAHFGQHWLSGGTAGFGTPPRSMSAPGAALGLRPRRALSSDRGDFNIQQVARALPQSPPAAAAADRTTRRSSTA